jgi:phosphoglycolate phosphatase-like HAD superfamily hydrolase
MIGDALSDIEFGRRLGMRTILVEGESQHPATGVESADSLADLRCASLTEAVGAVLALRQLR